MSMPISRTGLIPGWQSSEMSDDVVLGLMKEAAEAAYSLLRSTKDIMVKHVHMREEHDAENFRGCTHPDCVELRKYFKIFRL